ncbi:MULTISPECIES: DUF3144 domain-containing protein [unclassified Marinimicrobium]|jgi:hypothetical protein|uniref:DUF3144 domain-containing protein n=1 Tax=unclassified Marinimicrobium TaxID=2632100 RepID=UPI000C5215AB|nr:MULTISPECIES: DUF3144 domain-containing protein [unclassified Marinimicrobium]MAN52484.1 hypothetical protein [Marinimicrobium sp.]|tara:strand:- start:168 stop:482 length:315 start_codon:yes stop_codon:yes gene_type:complete
MNQPHDEDTFWNLVDEFIENANQAVDQAGDPALVSAALLQACSRFSAFVVATSSLDRKEYTDEIPSALSFLSGQFHEQLEADLEDYREHYKVYIANERPDEPLH